MFRFHTCSPLTTITACSIVYEIILVAQRLLTMSLLGAACFGQFSAWYAVCVTAGYVADAGVSSSWAGLYEPITCCRNHVSAVWRGYLQTHLLVTFVIATVVAAGIHFLLPVPLALDLLVCMAVLIVLQTTLAACRQFLYVVGQGQCVALQETFLLLIFFCIKMACLRWGFVTDAAMLLRFHAVHDVITLLCLVAILYAWWFAMPQPQACATTLDWAAVTRVRGTAYMIRLSRYLVSGRYVTPLFAWLFGFRYAGVYALTTKTIRSAISIIKVFGYAGMHDFAATYQKSAHDARVVLRSLTQTAFLLGLVSLAVCVGVCWYMGALAYELTDWHLSLLYLYLVICLSEGLVALFESCMLAVGKMRLLLMVRGAELGCSMLLVLGHHAGLSAVLVLCGIGMCRGIAAALLYATLVRACQQTYTIYAN